jgi:acyl-CoA dehydrogenase
MDFELPEDFRMLRDLARRFVRQEMIPLEGVLMAREAQGQGDSLAPEERARLDEVSHAMGLWALDAPAEMGGMDLPNVALVGVNEAIGSTPVNYVLPPDSPNLRMLMATASDRQRESYLAPYARHETVSAIAISEPGAGGDPAMMTTRADRDGDDWVINGRKIWITRADTADFLIVMAITDQEKRARGGMSAFLVDKGAPGLTLERAIPMIGGASTFELSFDNVRVPGWKMLGAEGEGFAAMQIRLGVRRLQIGAWCVGAAQRALDMIVEFAPQRVTFGQPLADRQAVQWWVADAEMKIHAARLMTYHAAWKLDRGLDVRAELSMVKVHCTETAWETLDRAMQCFGAMGMTKELPLQMLANQVRTMRIYEGPSEVHRWVVARNLLGSGR